MQRGNLIIYDETGKIYAQSGEAQGDVYPHEYLIGLPYIEMPHGTMRTKKEIGIDVSKSPHVPIFEDLITEEELEEKRLLDEKRLRISDLKEIISNKKLLDMDCTVEQIELKALLEL